MDVFTENMNGTAQNDDSTDVSDYSGIVELIHPKYMENGLIKVRVPILHEEMSTQQLPWAELTPSLKRKAREWDLTGPTQNSSEKKWPGVEPYNHWRKGRHLIRKGDRVQVVFIDGNLNHIWVQEILEFLGGDEGDDITPVNAGGDS